MPIYILVVQFLWRTLINTDALQPGTLRVGQSEMRLWPWPTEVKIHICRFYKSTNLRNTKLAPDGEGGTLRQGPPSGAGGGSRVGER